MVVGGGGGWEGGGAYAGENRPADPARRDQQRAARTHPGGPPSTHPDPPNPTPKLKGHPKLSLQ